MDGEHGLLTPGRMTRKFCRLRLDTKCTEDFTWRPLQTLADLANHWPLHGNHLTFIPAASKHRAPWLCAPPTVHSHCSSTVRLLKCQPHQVTPTFQWIRIKSKAPIVVLKTLVTTTQGASPSSSSTIPHCSLSSFPPSFPS